jgi:hypothetical protein
MIANSTIKKVKDIAGLMLNLWADQRLYWQCWQPHSLTNVCWTCRIYWTRKEKMVCRVMKDITLLKSS